LCRHCQAPMALAHQANSQKLRPQMVATIGSSGVGKTVYLGMLLDMLSHASDDMKMLARGAFSITLQQNAMQALSRCEFPDKTPNEPDRWNWVHCQLHRRDDKRPIELVMPDIAGEAMLQEVEHPYSYVAIRSFLLKCSGALVLVDTTGLELGNREQDYFTMKLMTYLDELDTTEKTAWSKRPVALVLSKSDQSEHSFDDPERYAQKHASGLWQYCRERFKNHKFFAAGVAGSTAVRHIPSVGRMRAPLRIEPRGIVEPFAWIVEQLRG
jgi:double-GTPase-like protein